MSLAATIAGVGLVGPGIASWAQGRLILAGAAGYSPGATVLPSPLALPSTERRRAGPSVRLALGAGLEAVAEARAEAGALAAVFASSSGDGENCHAICEALASSDRDISPTRFHNSVHNAPAGYWGIATGAMRAADCLAAFDASFGAGLLEALGRLAEDPAQPVLLVAYDAPYPQPLHAARPIGAAFAVALVLATAGRGPRLSACIAHGREATALAEPRLEQLRRSVPAARALPLLALLARGGGSAFLDYLDSLALAVEVAG